MRYQLAVCGVLFASIFALLEGDARAAKFTNAEYEEHIAELRGKLPDKGFTIVLEKPFVVIGDEPADVVRHRARSTIRWAVNLLKQDYFADDPDRILNIWLFKDKESYETNVERLFEKKPTTPFGYYSPRHGALVMNISTGSGTLVHEIVHPFIESNFEDCPSWFNEGLASLYEHCGQYRGRIYGYTNWRLKGLQKAIAAETEEKTDEDGKPIEPQQLQSFADLCSTSTREFYADQYGTNYAQARYLCYYLQQRGLLRKYYHAFRRAVDDDPSGYKTLVAILGSPDMDEFQDIWEGYVMTLEAE
ncbi:MAG: hypothetical protein MI757_10605 [Pirellulales bacterium]|nr:hypothetical protein [Pirellulales bacterium]